MDDEDVWSVATDLVIILHILHGHAILSLIISSALVGLAGPEREVIT
jgi:hypothetical protein